MSAPELREIGVGMLGYAFRGKAHSNAYRKIAYMVWPPPLLPRLVAIFGRTEQAVAEAARRYGYERWTTDWHDLVTDDSIGLFDNSGPNSLLRAIAEDTDVASYGATFEDGYRAAEVCDAIVRSSETGRREEIVYR
jgi:predicted dehydrogenase